jgi:hypothetical protein
MENSKQIQFSLLSLVLILLGLNLTSCGDSTDEASVREVAREDVTAPAAAPAPAATATADVPAGPTTTIEFEESEFDFGTIDEGEKVSHTYKFTNTGSEPLIIKDAKGSCGCTVPSWPKDPIAPGATGEMLVEFNSKGKSGSQNKRVTITSNTNPGQTFIQIKGEVNKAETTAKPVQ